MPELKCTVQTCMHNKDYYCDLQSITVGGDAATKAQDTCCDSFEERKSGTYSNMGGNATAQSTIHCQAQKCQYNDNCCCQAGKISVEGSGASCCGQTECATFICG